MEYDKKKEKAEKDEYGYSERQTDIDAEIQAGEWQNLKNFKVYHSRSRQWRVLATYKAVSNRLNQLVSLYYKLVSDDPHEGEKMLSELKKLRYMQEILLRCVMWEPKGEITQDMVPDEVWDLIK